MSERTAVIKSATARMHRAFVSGDMQEATDLNSFLNHLEVLDDAEYDECYGDLALSATSDTE